MIKKESVSRRSLALMFGSSVLGLSFACSSVDSENEEPLVIPRPPEDCKSNPYLVQCQDDEPPPATGGTGGGKKPPPTPKTTEELLKAQVQNILSANCGVCHGSKLELADAEGNMNYIDDLDALVENDKLIPRDAEGSFIIQRMRDGSMPPPSSDFTVSKADIDFVAAYIDDPDNWPGDPLVCDNPAVSFDEIYTEVADDLREQEADERQFFRYVSLANRVSAGVCTNTALDRDRHALTKLLNMLSIRSQIREPAAVDAKRTLFRVDLRDYDWNRAIVVNDEPFDDVWEAIIGANDYAVPFVGDEANDARDDSGTDVPVMFLDSMLDTAIIGNLYYATIDVDVTQSIDAFISDVLEIDVLANFDQGDVVRAGTTRTRVSRQNRLVEGHAIEARPGAFYQSFDFAAGQTESIFQDPFGFNEGGREAIFTLPNGLLAYLIADADGNLVEQSDILLDTEQGNFLALTAVSCSGCHASGFIPLVDEVRDVVFANRRQLILDGTLSEDQLEQLPDLYPDPAVFGARIGEDNEDFYLEALSRANLPTRGADPVSRVFIRFDRDVTLEDAAGDLGISRAELESELDILDPVLGVLRDVRTADGSIRKGSIDRDEFTAQYVVSLCELSGVLGNQPDAAFCDLALEELDP